MKIKYLFAAFLLFVLATAAFSQSLDKAKLDQFFNTLAENNKAMGSAAIAKNGNVIYSRATGFSRTADSAKTPSTVSTKYRIGSISKMFTAAMIFQLVEEGKIKLTDTLDKFFPNVPNAAKITISELLNHRSGIHNFTDDPEFPSWMTAPKTKDEMLAVISKGASDFEPDSKAAYSNSNYVLLGYIIEKLTGKSYGDALKERIAAKVGLNDTYLGSKTDATKNESYSYEFNNGWKQSSETDMSIPGGAGAVVSTASDLTKFIDALFNLKLISQASLDQMTTLNQNYGMGIFQYSLGGKKAFGHTGGIDGFNSMLVYLPEEKLSIAYISNGTVYPVNTIIKTSYAAAGGQAYEIPSFAVIQLKPEELDKFLGVYSSPTFPLKISVTKKDATLYTQATGQSEIPMEAVAPDKFKFDPAGIMLEFNAAKNQMTLKQAGREFVLTKE